MRKFVQTLGRWVAPAAIAIAVVAVWSSSRQPAIGGQPPPTQGDHGDHPGDHDADHNGGPDHGGPDGAGPDNDGGPGPGGMHRGPGGFGHGERGDHGPMGGGMGPGSHGPNWAPTLQPPQMAQVERLRGYMDLVDHFSTLAKDPTNSGIAAVITAGDVLRSRGPDTAIQFYNDILPKVEDPSIQRAIHTQLAEMYRAANKPEQAINELAFLMTGKPQEIKLPPATTQPAK